MPDKPLPEKEEIKIRPFWYSDIWVFPKLINIITTLDKDGRVNAAPYSFIMQYDVMAKRPRMMLGFRQDSHTYNNIKSTGELVINCPGAEHLDDMMETARFWPEGVNELEHTSLTPIPSRKVSPPSIAECPQIMECTVDDCYELPQSAGIVIANIEAIVMDKGLKDMGRGDRIRAMNLPIGLGDEDRRDYFHCTADNITVHTLADPPGSARARDVSTTLPWEADAQTILMNIPAGVRKMVCTQTEDWVKAQGGTKVTVPLFKACAAESGMDDDFFARFRK